MTLRISWFYRWRGRRAFQQFMRFLKLTPPIDYFAPDDYERAKLLTLAYFGDSRRPR